MMKKLPWKSLCDPFVIPSRPTLNVVVRASIILGSRRETHRTIGLRPYGVSFLFAGWDKQYGFQLYQTDPSGNYGGWKAQCIGTNSSAAQSILKEDYKPELTVDETLLLVTKILDKTMDSNTMTAEKCNSLFGLATDAITDESIVDIAKITREGKKTVYHSLTANELADVMKRHEAATAADKAKEAEKEKK